MAKPRFFLLVNRAQRALKTRVERETQGALGLTSLELAALWAVSSEPDLGIQGLARVLHVDHAVVSRLSKQLVRKGVARRAGDSADRRRTRLVLTERGTEKARAGHHLLQRANALITEGFTDPELATAARFLEHLITVGSDPSPIDKA